MTLSPLYRSTQSEPTTPKGPYFPAQILDKAKWTTAVGISLDGILTNWFALEGAITLGEVIAFSDGAQAQEVEVWAHELTHVIQYEELGIEAFAVRDSTSPI